VKIETLYGQLDEIGNRYSFGTEPHQYSPADYKRFEIICIRLSNFFDEQEENSRRFESATV